jgi:hypothetical protein
MLWPMPTPDAEAAPGSLADSLYAALKLEAAPPEPS